MRMNADVGEDPRSVDDGSQAALLHLVDDANVACGGHAGDAHSMAQTVAQCRALGVAVGAHPSTPDRVTFGRGPITSPPRVVADAVRAQLEEMQRVCLRHDVAVAHVKPHGALYHAASDDDAWALLVLDAMRAVGLEVPLVVLAGARTTPTLVARGARVRAEGFADRALDAAGRLVPRDAPGALITDPARAAEHARDLAARGIDTVCVHGDTPGALAIARAVRDALGLRR